MTLDPQASPSRLGIPWASVALQTTALTVALWPGVGESTRLLLLMAAPVVGAVLFLTWLLLAAPLGRLERMTLIVAFAA
ncbi:MAG: hypothetical protein AAGN66_20420, partial [Acidobacteriota bacterium]